MEITSDVKPSGTGLKEAIDKAISDNYVNDMREHLGASIVGRQCMREIWYSWRWAKNKKPSPRMIRLFDRGHREEHRFEEWLKLVCEEFHEIDPETGKQFRVSDFHNYFGGSLDGIMVNPMNYVGRYLSEFKTHSEKSFLKVNAKGVKEAKPEHYTQMQLYLHYYPDLQGAFYFAICKNDDNLYIEYVERDESHAEEAIARTRAILSSREPPERFKGANEHQFYCKNFCDYSDICYKAVTPLVTCRSCDFCKTAKEGFTCGKTMNVLDRESQIAACSEYERRF